MIAKVTFSFDSAGTVTLETKPEPIVTADEARPGGRAGSLARACDTAPYLSCGEVTFDGSARKDGGAPSVVRLAVSRDNAPLIDKRLVVRGASEGESEGRVALTYENAFGGVDVPTNPAGTPEGRVVHPSNATTASGFGPIAASWSPRRELLRAGDEEAWNARERTLRDDFPLSWFQTAPVDQRIMGPFRGTETVHLEGLIRGADRIAWGLGRPRVEARKLLKGGGFEDVPLALDTLRIDGASQRYSLVWRGYVDVSALAASEVTVFAVGFARGDEAIAWPAMLMRKRAASTAPPGERLATTEPVDVERLAEREAPFEVKPATPSERRSSRAVPWNPPGAGASARVAQPGQRKTVQQLQAMPDLVAPMLARPGPLVAPPMVSSRAPEASPVVLRPPAEIEAGGVVTLDGGLGSKLLVALATNDAVAADGSASSDMVSLGSTTAAPAPTETGSGLRLGGLTLQQTAGVVAALAEELPLDAVLSREGIASERWPEALDAWRAAIARAPDLQVQWVQHLREAEDCLKRDVQPLDDDPVAWAGLLALLTTGRDPAAKLRALGLRMSDVARIGRAWADKAAGDAGVAKALSDAAGRGEAPTVVRCGPTKWAGFPWSPVVPVAAKVPTKPDPSLDVPRLRRRIDGVLPVAHDVDLFAALDASLDLAPTEKARAFALTGLSDDDYEGIAARWRERFERSPEVRVQFVARSGDHRAAFRRLLRGATPRFDGRSPTEASDGKVIDG